MPQDRRHLTVEVRRKRAEILGGHVGLRPEHIRAGVAQRREGGVIRQHRGAAVVGLRRRGRRRRGGRRDGGEVRGVEEWLQGAGGEQGALPGMRLHRGIRITELQQEPFVRHALQPLQPGRRGLGGGGAEHPDRGDDRGVDADDRLRAAERVELRGERAILGGEGGELVGGEQRSVDRGRGERHEHGRAGQSRVRDDHHAGGEIDLGGHPVGFSRRHLERGAHGVDAGIEGVEIVGLGGDLKIHRLPGAHRLTGSAGDGFEITGRHAVIEPPVHGRAIGERRASQLDSDGAGIERLGRGVRDAYRRLERPLRGDLPCGADGDLQVGVGNGVVIVDGGGCRAGTDPTQAADQAADDERRGESACEPLRSRTRAGVGRDHGLRFGASRGSGRPL